jgi:hypothetical protein
MTLEARATFEHVCDIGDACGIQPRLREGLREHDALHDADTRHAVEAPKQERPAGRRRRGLADEGSSLVFVRRPAEELHRKNRDRGETDG